MSHKERTAPEIARLLEEFADRLALVGVSKFKVRAYRTAASNLKSTLEPLSELVAAEKLKSIPGVGDAIAEKIKVLFRTGTHPALETLRQETKGWFSELGDLPITLAQLRVLADTLKINTGQKLQAAAQQGQLEKTRGLGKRFQSKVLQRFENSTQSEKLRLNRATAQAVATTEQLKARYSDLEEVVAAGDVRRGCELCAETKYVLLGQESFLEQIRAKSSNLFVSAPNIWGVQLLYATGSQAHVTMLEDFAKQQGFLLQENGLFRASKRIETPTEEALYSALSLQFIEPELREGEDEIRLASKHALPDLVQLSDLKGVLHFHTDESDGKDSLSAMAKAAALLHLEYCGVCDHSPLASYAGGLTFERVLRQHKQADTLNARKKGKSAYIFKGIESDIRKDGALDYSPAELARFDFVVASVHARFGLSRDEQTARLIAAVRNPFTTILGHPTGRLLQSREPYEADMNAVLKACAEHGVAVEINGDPYRMDLDWRWHRRAAQYGCIFSIDPDAHDTRAYSYLRWGTAMARKGGLAAKQILNSRNKVQIADHFKERRIRALRR